MRTISVYLSSIAVLFTARSSFRCVKGIPLVPSPQRPNTKASQRSEPPEDKKEYDSSSKKTRSSLESNATSATTSSTLLRIFSTNSTEENGGKDTHRRISRFVLRSMMANLRARSFDSSNFNNSTIPAAIPSPPVRADSSRSTEDVKKVTFTRRRSARDWGAWAATQLAMVTVTSQVHRQWQNCRRRPSRIAGSPANHPDHPKKIDTFLQAKFPPPPPGFAEIPVAWVQREAMAPIQSSRGRNSLVRQCSRPVWVFALVFWVYFMIGDFEFGYSLQRASGWMLWASMGRLAELVWKTRLDSLLLVGVAYAPALLWCIMNPYERNLLGF